MSIQEGIPQEDLQQEQLSRRSVLKLGAGAAALAALTAVGCGPESKSDSPIISSPTAEVSPTQEVKKEPTTLREWADKTGFKIGIHMNNGYMPTVDLKQQYQILAGKEFNMGLVDIMWVKNKELIVGAPPRDYYPLIATGLGQARSAKMDITGHILFWSDPSSLHPDLIHKNFTRQETLEIMRQRIKGASEQSMGSFKNLVVVNEAYKPGDAFQRLVGDDYVDIAFEMAREAFPGVNLVYNDYANHSEKVDSSRLELTHKIVDRLKSKGLIDKVGLELISFYPNIPERSDIAKVMREYPVPVIVTEAAVNIGGMPGTQEERFENQKNIYRDHVSAAIDSENCNEFIIFDAGDKYSVWEADSSFASVRPDNDPTLFDDNLKPKPAYYGVQEALVQYSISKNVVSTSR